MKEKWHRNHKGSDRGSEYSIWIASKKYPLKITDGREVEVRIMTYHDKVKPSQDALDKMLEIGLTYVENNPKKVLSELQKERIEMAEFEGKKDKLKKTKVFGLMIETRKDSDNLFVSPESNLYDENNDIEGIAPSVDTDKSINVILNSKKNNVVTSVSKKYDINKAASESFIKNMKYDGRIAFGEAAEDEFDEELDDQNSGGGFLDEVSNNQGTENYEEDEAAEDEFDEELDDNGNNFDTDVNFEDEEDVEEEPEPVEKIHTIDTISQITNRFDQNMAQIGFDWNPFIVNGRIKKAANFKYIEDMRTHLNKLFDDKKFRYVKIYNKLYDMLTDTNLGKSWNLFGRENFGKPYLAEGAALLMYELTVEWVPVIVRYYKESPVFSDEIAPEEDSFFKKFPNLNLLTYVAAIIVENKDFKKLLTSQKSKDLLLDETKYNLTAAQAKKKSSLRGLGESLSYYAGLVKENFGDITAGFLDKIAVVAFLSINTKMPMNDRLSLVERLIKIVTTNTTAVEPGQPDPLVAALDTLNTTCTEFIKNRAEAKITLDSNEKNFPTVIIENSNRL